MKNLSTSVSPELGNATFVPLSEANWFRLEYHDVVLFRRTYSYVSLEIQLVPDTHLWKVQSIYGDLSPAARKVLLDTSETWANQYANAPRYTSRRQEQAVAYRKIDLRVAQEHLKRAQEKVELAIQEVLETARDIMDGVDCPWCGCFINPDQQKATSADDYPYGDAPVCPHCGKLLPEATLQTFCKEW